MRILIILTGYGDTRTWEGEYTGNNSDEYVKEYYGKDYKSSTKALIYSYNTMCMGHKRDGGSQNMTKFLRVININLNHSSTGRQWPDKGAGTFDTSDTNIILLARLIAGATSENETLFKQEIVEFMKKPHWRGRMEQAFSDDLHGSDAEGGSYNSQPYDTNTVTNSLATHEAEAAKIASTKFQTSSKSGDGVKRSMSYVTYGEGESAEEYTYIGPYNIYVQNISNPWGARITKNDGTQFYTHYYSEGINTESSSNIQNITTKSSINSSNFYIVVEGHLDSVNKIEMWGNYDTYRARMVLAYASMKMGQKVGIFYGEKYTDQKYFELPGIPYSNISITKIDETTNEELKNVRFIVQEKGSGKWIQQGTPINRTDNIKEATWYKTGDVIKNINAPGTFVFYEVQRENDKYEFVGMNDPFPPLYVGEVTVNLGETKRITLKNKKKYAHLMIRKEDEDTHKELNNARFVIQHQPTGEFVVGGQPASYTSNIRSATVYKTGDKIENLSRAGNYILWEIQEQDEGYEEASIDRPLYITEVNMEIGQDISVKMTNKRKYVKLSGYVWEDLPWEVGKNSEYTQLYNEGLFNGASKDKNDKLLNKIMVQLKDMNGNVIDQKLTNVQGRYLFEKVLIDQLVNYYIEFQYNGMCYQSIAFRSDRENGSKAIEGRNRSDFNSKYETITKGKSNGYELNYKTSQNKSEILYRKDGKESLYNYGYNGNENSKAPVNGVDEQYIIRANTRNAYGENLNKIKSASEIIQNEILEIPNINLGIVKREQPDLSLVKDLESIQVNVNRTTHVYRYGDRFKPELYSQYSTEGKSGYDMSPQVRYASKYGSMSYTRALYASDIYYNNNIDKIDGEQLKIKMTYKIGVKSTVDSLKSVVKEIEDYYDTKYFNPGEKLSVGKQIDNMGNIVPTSKLDYEVLPSGNTNYHKIKIRQTNLELDGSKNDGVIYVQLEVIPEKVIDILETQEKIDNYAEIVSYSIKDKNNQPYAGIDKDSQPGNLIIGNQDTYEDDTDRAPGIQLVLQEERKVQGTVFIDKTEGKLMTGEIRQGNGIFDGVNEEAGVDNVTVELINQRTGRIAQVYNSEKKTWEEARTITKNGGNYEIGGLLPETKEGYALVYTWGGQTYKKEDGTEELIRVQDYKGTIYNKEQEEKIKNGNNTWYKARDPRYSDAIDDYTTREAIDRQTQMLTNYNKEVIKQYNGNIQLNDNSTETLITQMQSMTPDFIVNLEYNEEASNHRDEYDLDSNGNIKMNGPYIVKKEAYQNLMKNIDFGIVERARQTLDLTKEVKKVRLILNNGTVLINAEIGADGKIKDQVKYATYIPNSEAANGQVKMEVDNEILQGARLEVQYGFKVENISELDYLNRDYYTYGNGYGMNNNELVSLNADTVIDYVDNNLAQNTENTGGWNVCPEGDKQKLITEKGLLASELKQTLIETNTVLTTQTLSKPLQPKGTTHQEATLTVYRMLPSIIQDEDSEMGNDAEIIKVIKSGGSTLTTTPGNYIPSEGVKEVDEAKSETVTIIPPTGRITNYIAYTLLSISSLGILVSGIILIKKFVLK